MTMEKKHYEKPTLCVVLINMEHQLLTGSPATTQTKFSDDEEFDDWTPGAM